MKGLLLIRRLFPETKHNPCFGIDYEIMQHPGWPFESPDVIVMRGQMGDLRGAITEDGTVTYWATVRVSPCVAVT